MSDDERWDLPWTWSWARAHQFATVVGGSTPKNAKQADNYVSDGIAWITPADLSGYKATHISRGARDLSKKGFASCSARMLPAGTVMLSSRAPVGYCVVAANDIATNQGFKSFVFKSADLMPEFFRYYLLGSKQYLESEASGTTFLELSGARALQLQFPVAPALEQVRITSKIDELFSRIEDGARALERVQKLVERYRQSVLKAAVTGELTRAWREQHKGTLESGEALLQRILASRRAAWEKAELDKMKAKGQKPANDQWKQKYQEPTAPDTTNLPELPEGWVWVTLDHVAECLDYAREPISATVRASRPGEIPYFGANGQVGTIDAYLFDEPLVLVVEDETFTGRTKPFSYKIEGKAWVNNHAHVLRPTSQMDVDFLDSMLMRYPFIPLTTGTTARRKLTQKSLMRAPMAVPPCHEQERIVLLLTAALINTGPAERDAGRAASTAKALRQSILRAAFAGDLVSQDPNDESALILLERIAAERSAATGAPKRGRKLGKRA